MKQLVFLMVSFSLVLSACASINASPGTQFHESAGRIVPVAKPTNISTLILAPTATKTPLQPKIPVTGENSNSLATSTAALGMDFSKAKVISLAHLSNGYFLVTVQLQGKVEGEFDATVGGEEFSCMVLEQYPNRLYCTGITTHAGQYAPFILYQAEDELPVYETEIGIPPVYITSMLQRTRKVNKSQEEPTEMPPEEQATPTPAAVPYPYPYPGP